MIFSAFYLVGAAGGGVGASRPEADGSGPSIGNAKLSGLEPTNMSAWSDGTAKFPSDLDGTFGLSWSHLTPSYFRVRGGPNARSNKSNTALIDGDVSICFVSPGLRSGKSGMTMVTPSSMNWGGMTEI